MAVKEITREKIKAKLDAGEEVILVETLGPRYYEDTHLPGRSTYLPPRWTHWPPRCCRTSRPRSSCTALRRLSFRR